MTNPANKSVAMVPGRNCPACDRSLRRSEFRQHGGVRFKSCPACSRVAGYHVFRRVPEDFGESEARASQDQETGVQSHCRWCRADAAAPSGRPCAAFSVRGPALPPELDGDAWTQRTARAILPLLIQRAEQRRPLTYSELDDEVVARGWGEHAFLTNYGQPLGAIGDVLEQLGAEWGIPIPPLNALVLNAKLGVPGPGCDWYIRQYSGRNYGQLGLTNKHKIVADIHRDMEDFAFWEEVLHGLGLEPLPSPQRPTAAYGFGGGESDEHRRLKEFVAANPAVVASSGSWRGQTEYPFRSGDAVDVMLISADACIAVEVKSAEASVAEQVRGVFQCVKYRALLRAEQTLAGRDPIGEAVLVVGGSLGPEARQIGRNLGVRVMEHVVVRPSGDR